MYRYCWIRAVNHPMFYCFRVWAGRETTEQLLTFSDISGRLHFSLHSLVSLASFLSIPKLWKAFPAQKYKFSFLPLVLVCKGGSLSQFRVCLGPEKLFLSKRAQVRYPSDVSQFLLQHMGTGLWRQHIPALCFPTPMGTPFFLVLKNLPTHAEQINPMNAL